MIGILLDVFVFGEPIQRALFLVGGSALGGFLGGFAGAIGGFPPGVLIGGIIGGIAGDLLGGAFFMTYCLEEVKKDQQVRDLVQVQLKHL